jgi:hypothetical protein
LQQLLCQGYIGYSNSKTILPATDAVGLTYYYLKTPPLHVGDRLTDNGIQGHVIAQYNLIDEYTATSGGIAEKFATIEE